MKNAAGSKDQTERLGENCTKVWECLPWRVPVGTGTLPLFRWRKITSDGETELSIGPSAAWALVALVALILKAVGASSFLTILWGAWRP
jgi:hypothetical protein